MSKDTYIHVLSFDLKMRNWPRNGALISIMSRKWIDAPRDDFSSLYLISPLIVFTVLWHRLNLETAPSKNATSLQWYRTVSALCAPGLSSFWSSLTLSFQISKGAGFLLEKGPTWFNLLWKFKNTMSQKWTDALTYDFLSLHFHLFRYVLWERL